MHAISIKLFGGHISIQDDTSLPASLDCCSIRYKSLLNLKNIPSCDCFILYHLEFAQNTTNYRPSIASLLEAGPQTSYKLSVTQTHAIATTGRSSISDLVGPVFPMSTPKRETCIDSQVVFVQSKDIGRGCPFCTRRLYRASERILFCPFHVYVVLVGRL